MLRALLNYLIRWDIDANKGFALSFPQAVGQPEKFRNESPNEVVRIWMGSEYYKHHIIEPFNRYGYTIYAGK